MVFIEMFPLFCPQVLNFSSKCLSINNTEKVLFALTQHYKAVQHPSIIPPTPIASHKTSKDTFLLWKCVYSGVDMRK